MKNLIKNVAYWAGVLVLGVALGVTIKIVGAWVEPDQMPPGGNIAAPLNTGNVGQTKLGGLILNTGGSVYGLIVQNGNSGFGTTTPTEKVEINGNLKVNGRILGVQAPINGSDVATKDYVDAAAGGGGGGSYTAFGTTDCAPDWTVAYKGVAMGNWASTGYGPSWSGGGGGIVCKAGEKFAGSSLSIRNAWVTATDSDSGDSLPCAVCVK